MFIKKIVAFTAIALVACVNNVYAYQQQHAKIRMLYVNAGGDIALKLDENFSEAVIGECETFNGYAGVRSADQLLKTFLLAQYLADKKVKIGVSGCDGNWVKIIDARSYVE